MISSSLNVIVRNSPGFKETSRVLWDFSTCVISRATSPSPCILSKVRTRCGLLTSFKSSNSWWFAGPHARPPHRSTLRKRPGDGFDPERTIFHSKCLLTSFKNLNSWWFAGPHARPPRRATLTKRPGDGFDPERTIFDSK